jgi:hypothetical protein
VAAAGSEAVAGRIRVAETEEPGHLVGAAPALAVVALDLLQEDQVGPARPQALQPAGDARARVGVTRTCVIADLNPVLRGWGNYFKTGNAAKRFIQIDTYVWLRLRRLRLERKAGTSSPARRRAGRASPSTTSGSTAYAAPSNTPGLHNADAREITRKPCAGNPQARLERGS